MPDPLSTGASIAQISQLALSARAAYVKAGQARNPDAAVQCIDETMSTLFKFSLYSQVSPDVATQYETFETEFLELNSNFEDAFAEQKFHQRLLQIVLFQDKPVAELCKKMKELHIRITSASANAEQQYRKVARSVQADCTHMLDIRMIKAYSELQDSSMSTDEFINQFARSAAASLLHDVSLEIYLTMLTHKLNAIGNCRVQEAAARPTTEPTTEPTTSSIEAESSNVSSYPPPPPRRNSMSAVQNPFADPATQNATEMERIGHSERAKAKMKSIFKRQ